MGSSKKVPVTLIYSDDKGVNWTSCELDNIYNAEDYYVDFFDENKGVIAGAFLDPPILPPNKNAVFDVVIR